MNVELGSIPSVTRPAPASWVAPFERRWLWAFSALVLLVTSLPYLLGFAVQGADLRFTGFVFGVEDGNTYIAKMLAGSYGAWRFYSPYTAYPQDGVWFYTLFILLGKLAAPPGLHDQLVGLFHLFRLLAGLLMIRATYDFIAFFISDVHLRRWGTAIAILGGGLGWLLLGVIWKSSIGGLPLDFYSPEAFGFLSLYGLPHLALARALMLWALIEYLRMVRAIQSGQEDARPLRSAVRLGLLWFLTGLAQPLTTLVLGALLAWHLGTLALVLLVRRVHRQPAGWRSWLILASIVALAGLLPGLIAVYYFWVSITDPYVRVWSAQNRILSPNFVQYILAYGLLALFAWRGGRVLLEHGREASAGEINLLHKAAARPHNDVFDWSGWLPVAWVLLFPLLAYLPAGIQRRLTDGVWDAWVVLAMAGFLSRRIYIQLRWRIDYPWVNIAFILFIPVLILLAGGVNAAVSRQPPLFVPYDEVRVFEYLQANAGVREVVLAPYDVANELPAWAPVRVVAGHGPESIHLPDVLPRVEAFYNPATPDADRFALLHEFNVSYVIAAPVQPGGSSVGGWNLGKALYLQEVFQSGEYRLYRVEVLP